MVFRVHFKKDKFRFKYFGLSPQFEDHMKSKGNRLNMKGVYFGCGGQTLGDIRHSIQSMSSVKTIQNSDYFGLYYNINGQESIVSESTCI